MINSNQNTPFLSSGYLSLLLLFFLVVIFSGVGSGLVQLIGKMAGVEYTSLVESLSESTPIEEKNFIRFALLLGQLFTFLLPAVVFAWLLYKKESLQTLLLNHIPRFQWLAIIVGIVLFIFPIVQWTFSLNKELPLPDWAIEQEALINEAVSNLLQVTYPYELLLNILIIGVLPAVGEELIFRGIIQQRLQELWQHPHLAIWVTAILFSFIHFQFQGFLPRVFLGAALGYMVYWTRNLWTVIFAHFLYNSIQIVAQYVYYKNNGESVDMEVIEQPPIGVTIFAIAMFLLLMVLLRNASRREILAQGEQ